MKCVRSVKFHFTEFRGCHGDRWRGSSGRRSNDHPAPGIGASMYGYVLDIMRAAGMKYAKVGTGGRLSCSGTPRLRGVRILFPFRWSTTTRSFRIRQTNEGGRDSMSELQTGPRLIIVCGLPGSGKTTHAKQVEQNFRAVRFCPDEWMNALEIGLWEGETRQRIERLQWKLAQDLLTLGHTVVIEWGTWARSERDALRIGARALGAAVELHFLDFPAEVLFDRIRRRNMESPAITLDDLLKWAEAFERPSSDEMALFDPGGGIVNCLSTDRADLPS
jgi:predicted kinase